MILIPLRERDADGAETMQQMIPFFLVSTLTFTVLVGCGGDSAGGSGGAGSGGTATGGSAGSNDGMGGASNGGDTATGGDTGTGGAGGTISELGFEIRRPATYTIECTGDGPGAGPTEMQDADTLCTFEDGSVSGYIYLQATPVSCMVLMSAVPVYEVQNAWISVDGTVEPLQNASYDYGGNHQNDTLQFDYEGKTYMYDHSSFGFGGRSCHAMDCVRITEGSVTDDGCTCDRTHPVVCAPIQADGTHDDLGVDTFAVCLGDESCGG